MFSSVLHSVFSLRSDASGRYNLVPDALSRESSLLPEWTLSSSVCHRIFQQTGRPTIDLFASHRAHVVSSYVSFDVTDTTATWCDAYSRPWRCALGWLFPPPLDIHRVLLHLQQPTTTGDFLLITPMFLRAAWLPSLRRICLRSPIHIPDLHLHLVDLQTGRPPPHVQDMELVVWRICLEQGSPKVSQLPLVL
jgi:hypothetical protein